MKSPHHSSDDSALGQKMLWGLNHGVFRHRLGACLKRAWSLGISDSVIGQLVEDELRPLRQAEALGRLPPFKAARLKRGQGVLGWDIHGGPIYFMLAWLLSGLLLISTTGGGKSNLLCSLVLQLAQHCVFWLSESYKDQLRQLHPLLKRLGMELIIIGCRDWRWNLLQSHIRDARLQLTLVVDLLTRGLKLPPRSRSILAQGMHELYRRFGIWSGNRAAWPTLFDLYEWVRVTRGLNPQARDAILDRLGALLLALTPGCAAYRFGWSSSALARHHILFEMRGTTETAKQILLNSLLFSVFYGEVERGVVNGPPRLVIAFDDSQRMFDVGAQNEDLASIDELAGVIRGTGISLWVLAQSAAGLSRRLIANLGNKIIGPLSIHEDYASLGADMGLSAERLDWARLRLRPGQFIGQLSQEWREPFAFEVPLLEFNEPMTDLDAAESLRALDTLPTVFADEFAHWQPYPVVELQSPVPPSVLILGENDLRVLREVVANPGKPSSYYCRATRLSGRRLADIRKRLSEQGYIREHKVALSSRGRAAILLEPLAPGVEALRANSENP